MWIHINFWFKGKKDKQHRREYYLKGKQLKEFNGLIKQIVKGNPFIKRKFFLYEPSPHCFLALEIKDCLANSSVAYLNAINIVNCIKRKNLSFIHTVYYKLNSGDEHNGENFLNCLHSITDLIIDSKTKSPPWLKKFPLKGLSPLAHLIHCALNSATSSRPLEREFYKAMLKTYKRR